jgi:hypothetical protein
VEIQVEARELVERSSRSPSLKLTNNIANMRKVEVLKKDSMEEEVNFLEVEVEEDPEEAWLNAIPMEKKDINIGNVPTEKEKKAENHTLSKHINMWKKKKQKEEETS